MAGEACPRRRLIFTTSMPASIQKTYSADQLSENTTSESQPKIRIIAKLDGSLITCEQMLDAFYR
jgi:hypothetical protein